MRVQCGNVFPGLRVEEEFVSWPLSRGGVDRCENISHSQICCIWVFVLGPPQANCLFIVNIHELAGA
jgi:hypothetical protein